MEYYVGQIFEDIYPAEAADWCNNQENIIIAEIEPVVNKTEEEYEDFNEETNETEIKTRTVETMLRRFQIQETQVSKPSREDVSRMREAAYAEIDKLHNQKMRHQVIGDWTEEDEEEYKEKVIRLSEEIKARYPYAE